MVKFTIPPSLPGIGARFPLPGKFLLPGKRPGKLLFPGSRLRKFYVFLAGGACPAVDSAGGFPARCENGKFPRGESYPGAPLRKENGAPHAANFADSGPPSGNGRAHSPLEKNGEAP